MPNETLAAKAGIFGGRDPIAYDSSNPLTLFLVQAFIIIIFCRIVHYPLSLIRQPRVIGEVIGGILLGPTVMGRIPNFTNVIFPKASIPNLTLVANIGIILFLFVVGLEIDMAYVKKNWKIAATVGLSSLALPFCLGVALAVGLYKDYVSEEEKQSVSFGVYSLFIGVALAITAFPVLARILTELGLLRDKVGIVVLAAGISNDIVGWVLLALTITLSNSGKGVTTVYIILVTVGWFIFLAWGVRPILSWYLHKSGSIEHGPNAMAISVCILLCFVSAFFTDIIGVHPIFGAFLAGTIIPRENHFVVKLTDKIEDFISLILLPLYFALAGLNVNMGALNDGKSWGYVIGSIGLAMFGKVFGALVPAKLHGLRWRESFAVGGLMSCKGIVEIVVLQLGLQAGILSVKVFTIFVIMALITTFFTTPLTLKLYPQWYRTKVAQWRAGEIEWDGTVIARDSQEDNGLKEFKLGKMVILLDNVETMSTTMMITQLLAAPQSVSTTTSSAFNESAVAEHPELAAVSTDVTIPGAFVTRHAESHGLWVSGLRLIDLSERTADVMQVMNGELLDGDQDPVIKVFSTFTRINRIPFEGQMTLTPQTMWSDVIVSVSRNTSDFLLITWDEEGELIKSPELLKSVPQLKDNSTKSQPKLGLIKELYGRTRSKVGFFIDRGFALAPQEPTTERRIYLPFYGGANDVLALGLAVYLANNANVKVFVAVLSTSVEKSESTTPTPGSEPSEEAADTFTLLPSEAWDHVTGFYDALPADMQAKFTLLRMDDRQNATEAALAVFTGGSQVSDLVLIGRATPFTANSNVSDHQLPSQGQYAPASPGGAPAGIVPGSTSEHLFGAAVNELVTSPQLKASFFICNSAPSLRRAATSTNLSEVLASPGKVREL